MAKIHCFTSATFAYMDRVRVLGQTLKAHNPDWIFTLCLSDQEPPGWRFDPADEPIDNLVRITELDIPDLTAFIFEHDVVELCTAVKAAMLNRLFAQGAEKVVYLDPDIAVFASLQELEQLLDEHDIVLTPHQLTPDTDPRAVINNELGTLKYGMYNLGFLAVANNDEGRRFGKWWEERLATYCFDDVSEGIFTDQKWCDFVPAFFSGTYIWRDPGCNVASWNLSQRPISIDGDGVIRAGNAPLKFFHFTKVDWIGAIAIERFAMGRIATFELLNWYQRRLADNETKGLPKRYWAYGSYADGSAIPKSHRRLFRDRPDLRTRFPDPFKVEPALFEALLSPQ